MNDDLKQEVRAAMAELRPVVDAFIDEWMSNRPSLRDRMKGLPVTTGLCRGVSAGVQEVLEHRFPDCHWTVSGGFGEEYSVDRPDSLHEFVDTARFPGGMVDLKGAWSGHFWVEGAHPDSADAIIVDLAADQFGHDPILVIDASDPRYRDNSLLGQEDMIRPAERAWGLSVFERWEAAEAAPPRRVRWI
jgi:hypothetical protein